MSQTQTQSEVIIYEMYEDILFNTFNSMRGFSLSEYESEFGSTIIDLSYYEEVFKFYFDISDVDDFLNHLHDEFLDPEECSYDNYFGRGTDIGNVILIGSSYYFIDRMGFEKVNAKYY